MAVLPMLARVAAAKLAIGGLSKAEQEAEAKRALYTFVSSSAIKSIGWRDEIITVQFQARGTYTYPGTKEDYLEFISAGSIGQYFNANIKPRGGTPQ
jgi:KTSC domain